MIHCQNCNATIARAAQPRDLVGALPSSRKILDGVLVIRRRHRSVHDDPALCADCLGDLLTGSIALMIGRIAREAFYASKPKKPWSVVTEQEREPWIDHAVRRLLSDPS